ncbi:MAG: hypothetical protein ABW080_05920 [Candidatus Thiodiazotropha sp.]
MMNIRIAALLVLLSWGSSQAATVSLYPDSSTVNVGDLLPIDIIGSEFIELNSGIIDLGMDAGLQVHSVTINPYWDLADSGYAQSPAIWSDIQFDTLLNPPVSGDVTIGTVVFEALSPGHSVLSILNSSEFYSPFDTIVPDAIDSQVSIAAVPLPPAALLFVFGLVWMLRLSGSDITRF